MSFFDVLSTVFIGPLKLIFEIIYRIAYEIVGHPGVAIIFLSIVMNVLVLPLYRRADAMQEEARDKENKLRPGVTHIKRVFSGDEKMMVLGTYYRQNGSKPTDSLKGTLSLLLEIPFFMAAYQFLSGLDILSGVSFGPISDLAAQDGLIRIGSLTVNLLPILMTLINVISCVIYLKGFPLKSKIQLYGMALFFLVFLYTSPAGLVFYWTLNNLFSLVKTIFYKLKHPALILRVMTLALGLALGVFTLFFYHSPNAQNKSVLIFVSVLLLLPAFLPQIAGLLRCAMRKIGIKKKEPKSSRAVFILSCAFLTVFVGLLIPATYLAASPQEYVDISYFHDPILYLVSSVSMAAGLFLVWVPVFYWLATKGGKVIFARVMLLLCGSAFVNFMFFGRKLGILSPTLQYEKGLIFKASEVLLNVGVLVLVLAVLYFIVSKWQKIVPVLLLAATVAFGGMSFMHIGTVSDSVDNIAFEQQDVPHFTLSRNGKNVIVLMLDRGMGAYIPYLFNEKPELREKFDGFTYYDNVISHGGYTNMASPSVMGGYEYTPVELNKRENESLKSKHNEALKVMPVLFSQNGYRVTVCDPVYANYNWVPDTSIFDEYEGISTYVTEGFFSEVEPKQATIDNNHRNFFCFGLMKSLPLFMQSTVYDGGNYNKVETPYSESVYGSQKVESGSTSVASGLSKTFMEPYNVLVNLPYITKISDEKTNTFLSLVNNTTHEPMLLQMPSYTPSGKVDNTPYEKEDDERFLVGGRELHMNTLAMKQHYQTNMAVMLKLGEWFDYMREQGVYDNTRIVIVSDHGRNLEQIDALQHNLVNANAYFPLLLVKDFDSSGFETDSTFMTAADVPTIATGGLIASPVNPFTGKPINSDEKTAHPQYIICSHSWNVNSNNGNTFKPSTWARVDGSLWDASKWSYYSKSTVLFEHAFPNER